MAVHFNQKIDKLYRSLLDQNKQDEAAFVKGVMDFNCDVVMTMNTERTLQDMQRLIATGQDYDELHMLFRVKSTIDAIVQMFENYLESIHIDSVWIGSFQRASNSTISPLEKFHFKFLISAFDIQANDWDVYTWVDFYVNEINGQMYSQYYVKRSFDTIYASDIFLCDPRTVGEQLQKVISMFLNPKRRAIDHDYDTMSSKFRRL